MSTKEVQYKDYVNFLDGYKNNAKPRAINKPEDAVDNGVRASVPASNLKPFNQYIENYNTSRFKPVRPTFITQQQQQIQDECKKDINSIVRNFEKNSLEEFTEPKRSVSRSSSNSTTNSSSSSNFKTRGFPLAGNGSISSSRSSTASSIHSPSPNHSISSEFPIVSPPISPQPSITSSTEDYPMISPCSSPPPPPPPLPTAAPPKFKSPPRQFVGTNNAVKMQSNSPCQRVVKIQINSNDKNASKIIDQNDPRVKKAVYGALRNMYGAYHEKANEYVATLPKNRVRKGNNLDKIIDSIAAEGGLEKLCGRAKIEADEKN